MTLPRSIILALSTLFIVILAILANEGLSALPKKRDTGVNHALIIGISNYDKWPKLKSPSKDAEEIAKILKRKYDFKDKNVVLLTDNSKERPTRVNILTYLDKYVTELKKTDNLLIFFSGHSTEDEKGETYWIPKNAKKEKKFTWLKHSDISREFLASKNFKAKNLCIVTDSLFSKKLIKRTSIVLSPDDLRYNEKIIEHSLRRSREVISFGDQHWPGSKRTEGFGLFTYYFRKALLENWLKVIDLENLIFTEKTILAVSRIAGTKMFSGRLRKTPMEKRGQSVITRVISPPVINIAKTNVSPKKGYVGDKYIVQATTTGPALEVYIELGGKKYFMDGVGTQWKRSMKLASLGTTRFKVVAINQDDILGKPKLDQITAIKGLANVVNVTAAAVSPKRGMGGDEYHFTANTNAPTKKVTLIVEGKRFEMSGADTKWSLRQKIEDVGSLAFSVIAINDDGVEGRSKGGILLVKAPEVKIVAVRATPGKGYAGDEFLITAKTDHPASTVSLKMDGVMYEMKGSGKEWSLKRKIPDVGKKSFTVIAKNLERIVGPSKIGALLAEKRPLGIPDIATIALSPKKVHAGESFMIRVKTSSVAKEVFIEMEGKKHGMDGSGTDWKLSTQIASVGTSRYNVQAKNKEGQAGRTKEGKITTTARVAKGVDVVTAVVSPKKGNLGQTYTFKATTNVAAQAVTVVIGEKRYKMTGSGTGWSLKRKIDNLGTIDFYMIATDKKGVEGSSKGGSLLTKALLANILKVTTTPDKGFAGDEFLITAKTDHPASTVTLKMDGVTYDMEGSGTEWQFRRKIPDIGKKSFTAIAENIEGAQGKSKTGELLTRLAIPNVASVALDPKKIHAGDSFLIQVKTSATAAEVYVEIEGKRHAMQGTGTEWKYMTQIASVGTSRYKVQALNKEKDQGLAKEGEIVTTKRPADLANVAKAEVNPPKGFSGGKFTFTANTDVPAKGVTLTLEGKNYKMTGSGTKWSLTRNIKKTGSLVFSMVAINEDKVEGGAKTATITLEEIKKRFAYNKDGTITDKITGEVKKRFRDNGDGTVTDLGTNLMWLKQPKRVAVTFQDADKYCRDIKIKDYSGWRLPTVGEWKNIIDKKQRNPALPPGHPFANVTTRAGYWSKSKHKFGPLYVYQVNLWDGRTAHLSKKKTGNVWAVRYAEVAQ